MSQITGIEIEKHPIQYIVYVIAAFASLMFAEIDDKRKSQVADGYLRLHSGPSYPGGRHITAAKATIRDSSRYECIGPRE